MKVTIWSLLVLFSLIAASCHKDKGEKKICKMEECVVCDDNRFDNKDHIKDHYIDKEGNKIDWQVEKYILSPIVKDNDCGYIVSGKVKYVVNGKTAAIVDYGDGEIDGWAVKTIYHKKDGNKGMGGHCNKDKYKESTKCCKFEQKCIQETDVTSTVNIETEATH
jgi:hypothetical protein